MDSEDFVELTENKYNRLLTALFLFLIAIVVPERYHLVKVAGFGFFLIAMLSIVRQIKPVRWIKRFYTLLIIGSLLLLPVWFFKFLTINTFNYGQFLVEVVLLLVIGLPIFLIQKEIFLTEKVTADTIKGGIAIYLLLGLVWATFYDALYGVTTDAFSGISPSQYQADFLHFSFVTLTTVGYGEILPVTALARFSADLEAIAGVMYPAILIARLVSLYKSNSQEPG